MNVKEPVRFSIIIPTYNSAKTLIRCLDSIVNQDYKNFEICIIDGSSSDGTLNLISAYQLKCQNINLVSEPDKGIYDAMNKGIDLSTGDWLYFIGSDDTFFDVHVLSTIANKIINCSSDVIYGNVKMIGHNQWNLDGAVFDGQYDTKKFLDRNICHQAIFYRRSLVKKAGYYNLKYVTNADFDFNLRCYALSQFTFADVIVANFYVGGHSTLVEDRQFHMDRGALLMKYFGLRIFSALFSKSRLYLKRAALSKESPLNAFGRCFCLMAYIKLKACSLLHIY